MALKGNAAFLVDGPLGEQVYLCSVPPRIVSTRQIRRRYTEDSLDRRTRNIVTIGAPVYEVTMRARFADRPADLLALLDAAANGYPITYIHDLSQPDGYVFALIHGDDAIEAVPDPDRFAFAEYDTTLTLRSATPFAPLLDSRGVLFRYHAGGAFHGTFTRASQAWRVDRGGVLESVAANVLRTEWLDLDGDGHRETPAVLVEGAAATNVARDSSNFAAAGTAWGTPEHWTITTATSLIDGQTAYRHTNDGLGSARERGQDRAMFSGDPETFYVIVENVDATVTEINLRSSTANANIMARLTWATGAASVVEGTGTAHALKLAERGPNGGVVYLLAVTGTHTASEFRRLIIYPTGRTVNTATVILHHAQHVVAGVPTSPIVTTSAASATRAAESLTAAYTAPPQAMAVYARFEERGGVLSDAFANLVMVGSGGNRLQIQTDAIHRYQIRYSSGGTNRFATLNAAPEIGDAVELLLTLTEDGTATLYQSIGGDAATSISAAALALPVAWGAETITIGGGEHAFRDLVVLRGSSWTLSDVRRLLP